MSKPGGESYLPNQKCLDRDGSRGAPPTPGFGNEGRPRHGAPRSTPLVIHKNQLSTLILTEQSWRSLCSWHIADLHSWGPQVCKAPVTGRSWRKFVVSYTPAVQCVVIVMHKLEAMRILEANSNRSKRSATQNLPRMRTCEAQSMRRQKRKRCPQSLIF